MPSPNTEALRKPIAHAAPYSIDDHTVKLLDQAVDGIAALGHSVPRHSKAYRELAYAERRLTRALRHLQAGT